MTSWHGRSANACASLVQGNHQTQAVVAGLSGITTDYLYQIERGKKLPALPVAVPARQGAAGAARRAARRET